MAQIFDTIDERLKKFIEKQKMFFVATAPLSRTGHVNVSPKGYDSFRILGPNRVAYLDLSGSGAETIAHLKENGRICIMFCAFDGLPKILRLHGQGMVYELGSENFDQMLPEFPEHSGTRAVIDIQVTRIADSCGWSVPKYEFKGDRENLKRYYKHWGEEKLAEDRVIENSISIDGLLAFDGKNP